METTQQDRLLQLPEVEQITQLGSTSIYDSIKRGSFPKPLKIGTASRWLESEVQEWIRKLRSERDRRMVA